MSKNKRLEKLHQEIRRCKKCELYKTKINAVPGEGPANTEVIFIGQNPGLNEAKTGKPFIGMAGKFLNKLLEIAKINRNEVFITSVLKCRTPKNRKPTKKEIKTCLPYLKKQIEVINPKKFILLGEVAFSVFFPKEKLKNFRGKWVTLRQVQGKKKFFITYHPAAGIRSPKRIRKILEKDFKKIKNLI